MQPANPQTQQIRSRATRFAVPAAAASWRRSACLATLALGVAGFVATAQASLQVHEPFDYTAESAVSGQNSGVGWADQDGAGSLVAWDTHDNAAGFVATQPSDTASNVLMTSTVANPYTNTFTSFPQTGGYAGPSDGFNQCDHLSMWRTLHPNVTATFQNGNTTWFAFATARAVPANARAPSFAIGAGILTTFNSGDRGDTIQSVNQIIGSYPNTAGAGGTYNSGSVLNGSQDFNSKEAIAIGGDTTSAGQVPAGVVPGGTINGVAANVGKVGVFVAQKYDASGVRSLSGYVGGGAFSSTAGTGPLPGDHGYWMVGGGGASSLLYGYSSVNTPVSNYGDNQSHINIVVAKIQWGAGTNGGDLVSFGVFHDLDALTETNFDSFALTYDTATPSNKATFNQVSIAGGRYFVDELRIGTTFGDAVGLGAAGSSDKDIVSFGPGAVITGTNISWTVPYGTNLATLAPTYTVSPLASGSPASGVAPGFDVTNPVTYTITAEDASTKDYIVTVLVGPANSGKDILTFGPGADISGTDIAWTVPFGTDLATLAPIYTVSPQATGSPLSGVAPGFDMVNPQTYTITAEDTSTQYYTVTVTVAPASSEKDILTFGIPNYPASIAGTNITWVVPLATDLATLAPTYTVSEFAAGSPVTGVAPGFNTTNPATYTITAQDGSTQDYTVTVVPTAASGKIHVNIDNSTRTGLEGPAGGLNTYWNQLIGYPTALTASNLRDSANLPTTIGYTASGSLDGLDTWGSPSLGLIAGGLRSFDTGPSNQEHLVISNLATDKKYNLYIASANCDSGQRSKGVFATTNTTTTVGSQTCDNTATINGSSWVLGNNYVLFENVEPDLSGNITVDWQGVDGRRAPLSGFQLAEAVVVPTNTFASWISGLDWSGFTDPDLTATGDPDGDNLDNGVEYVLGTAPNAANAGGPIASTDGDNFVVTFQRAIASKTADTALAIEVGTDLMNWPGVYDVGTDTASSDPGITVGAPADGFETVTLSILKAPDTTKFGRLRVIVTP